MLTSSLRLSKTIASSLSYRNILISKNNGFGKIVSLNGRFQSSDSKKSLTDEEILKQLNDGTLSHHKLESITKGDSVRAVNLRRKFVEDIRNVSNISIPVEGIPAKKFYDQVDGANCEGVIGYIPIPVGIAGPLDIDGTPYYVPMATTEGALIASTNRGARAISKGSGVTTAIFQDGMTRAPALECENLAHAAAVKAWIENPSNFQIFQSAFQSTTRYGRLETISVKLAGRLLFVRMRCFTGDAMGMNMIGKGSNEIVSAILKEFPTVSLKALSGNYCTDKKPAAVNWIEGRGKSVAAEAVIPKSVVASVLKTTVDAIVDVNITKNLIGSAMAGSMGGFNAHAANMLTAVYLATGQDPAQNVESSNCITLMEKTSEGDLRISVTMPCVEVGTVGGGTSLPAQKGSLTLLGIAGAHPTTPGANARQLARIISATVLAGELSLMAALSVNHLVSAHMQLNRKPDTSVKTPEGGAKSGHVSADNSQGFKINDGPSEPSGDMPQEESFLADFTLNKYKLTDEYRRLQLKSNVKQSSDSLSIFNIGAAVEPVEWACPSGYAIHRLPVP